MNSPIKSILRMSMLCVVLSICGNLNAHPTHKHPKSRYYYYTRQNIYYDPAASVYFVWERSYWKPVPYPPGRYVALTPADSPRFELWIASEHPYYYNVEHRRTYHSYRVVAPPPPVARARVVSRPPRPQANVSFQVNINPEPVYVERHVVVVKERGHGHHHHHPGHGPRPHPGRGHGHGHGHGRGHGHR